MKDRGDFITAFLWTAVSIVLPCIASAAAVGVEDGTSLVFLLFFVAAVAALIAPIVALGFVVAGKKQVATGIAAGFGIGLVAVALTIFVVANSTLEF